LNFNFLWIHYLFEWDDRKRRSNVEKHGVDFDSVEDFDWLRALVFEDQRKAYGERRFVAFLPMGSRLHVVVYAERGSARRLISVRKANAREVTFYENSIGAAD